MTRLRVYDVISVWRRMVHGMFQGWVAVRTRCVAVRSDVAGEGMRREAGV